MLSTNASDAHRLSVATVRRRAALSRERVPDDRRPCLRAGSLYDPSSTTKEPERLKYVAPNSLEEAVQVLASTPEARVFAGATDLIPQLRAGRREPGTIVDLKRIARLTTISRENGTWTVGAATPASDVTAHADFR